LQFLTNTHTHDDVVAAAAVGIVCVQKVRKETSKELFIIVVFILVPIMYHHELSCQVYSERRSTNKWK
jgi:hypothetical protein